MTYRWMPWALGLLLPAFLLPPATTLALTGDCAASSCANGTCSDLAAGGHSCLCDPGFAGSTCAELAENLPLSTPTTSCSTETFTSGLGALHFDFVGDADQGGAQMVNGRLQLTSDGTSMYHGSDNGGFVHKSVTGDFRAQVQLTGFPVNAGGANRRSGLSVRAGTGPNAARIFVEVLPSNPYYGGSPAIMFDYRDANGTTAAVASTTQSVIPAYLAIDRRGNDFSVAYSVDGVNWVKPGGGLKGMATITMPATVEVGMMSASYDSMTTLTSEFDDLQICKPNSVPLPPLTAAAPCSPARPLDIVYLLDVSGSAGAPFENGPTKLDAARHVMEQMNQIAAATLPGSRAALVVYRGGTAPAYTTGAGAAVLSSLTSSFGAVEAAALAINVASLNPTTSSPLSQGIDLVRQLLVSEADPLLQPVVIVLGDGSVNVDFAGNGPQYYKSAEMQALSIRTATGFRTVGEVAWLGNWNGAIATWDGQPLADAMDQMLRLRQDVPTLKLNVVGMASDATYRPDLLAFMAKYGNGIVTTASNAASLAASITAAFRPLDCQQPLATHRGLTWTRYLQREDGVVHVGFGGGGNAYQGDTLPSVALPILCIRIDGSPVPPDLAPNLVYNDGWAPGHVAASQPVQGAYLTSIAAADAICSSEFGPGWRMTEFHDGRWGPNLTSQGQWNFWSNGPLPANTRFWVRINNQPANPWN